MDDTEQEKVYKLSEAAAAAGVSLPTIRRKREQLVAAGAVADPSGWKIPHSALIAAGFKPDWTTADVSADEKPQVPHQEPVQAEPIPEPTNELRAAQDRVRRLESENMILRSHVERWETIARERLDALNDMRVAFRALAMTQPREIEAKPAEAIQPATQPEQPKRGWWDRLIHG